MKTKKLPSLSLLGRPNSNVVDSHLLSRNRCCGRSRGSSNRVRIATSHGHVQNDVEPLLNSLRPLCRTKTVLRDGVSELAVDPKSHRLRLLSSIDDNFVGVKVSGADAPSAGERRCQTTRLVANAAWVDVLQI